MKCNKDSRAWHRLKLQWKLPWQLQLKAISIGMCQAGDRQSCLCWRTRKPFWRRKQEAQLDFVHPADVVALSEGAQEAPAQGQGDAWHRIDKLRRDIGGVMNFVPQGHEQVRQLIAAVTVWSAAERQGEVVEVNTQTSEGASEGQLGMNASQPWRPPLDAEQWSGTVPSSTTGGDTQTSEPGFPTDADLLEALEAYEHQEREEALEAAKASDVERPTEGDGY